MNKSVFPVKDEDSNVIQVIEYIKDVTYVVKLENRLHHSERLSGIGKLAAGVAHEIRNPLSSIKAAAQLCLSRYEPDERIRKNLKIIVKNSERVNRVIRNLLNLARPHNASFNMGNGQRTKNLQFRRDILKRLLSYSKSRGMSNPFFLKAEKGE
jgi:two-component system nitrogen regulation sensor histidine kinase GlnL